MLSAGVAACGGGSNTAEDAFRYRTHFCIGTGTRIDARANANAYLASPAPVPD
jgi:hypothetical protein